MSDDLTFERIDRSDPDQAAAVAFIQEIQARVQRGEVQSFHTDVRRLRRLIEGGEPVEIDEDTWVTLIPGPGDGPAEKAALRHLGLAGWRFETTAPGMRATEYFEAVLAETVPAVSVGGTPRRVAGYLTDGRRWRLYLWTVPQQFGTTSIACSFYCQRAPLSH